MQKKGADIIRSDEVIKDESGQSEHLISSVDLDSRSGSPGAERKVKGTLHWVNANDNVPIQFNLYEPLLKSDDEVDEDIDKKDFISRLNPDSVKVLNGFAEKGLETAKVGDTFQFLRTGYFCKDRNSTDALSVYNLVVGLKDSYRPAK